MKMYTDFPDYRQFVQTFFVDNRREEQLRLEQAMARASQQAEGTEEDPFEGVKVFPQLPGAPIVEVGDDGEIVITGPISESPADGAVGDGIDSGFLPGVNIPIIEGGGGYS